MFKRTLSLMLSVILILSVCVIPQIGFAAEGFSKSFSTADDAQSLAGWTLPEGYVLSDTDGLTHANTMQKVYYNGGTFSGKYEYSVDFKSVYENPVRVITNYIDKSNYYYIEINPKKSMASLKTFRRGSISTHGTYNLPFEIKATNLVTARIISNGGEGMSMYLKLDGGAEAAIFENIHVKDYIDEGTIGFDSQSNPLKVNNFKVTLLGEKDFVPPVEEEKPDESEETNTPGSDENLVEKVYDETALKVITALGIMDKSALEDGKAQVTAEEFAQVIKNLKSEYVADEEAKITIGTGIEYMVKILGYNALIGSRNSYYNQANSLKLLSGIDAKTSDSLIRYDLAQMIYNALDVEILQYTSYGEKVSYTTIKGQTLLTFTLEMGMVEGQVTDNGVTAINGPSQVGQYHMIINGSKFFLHRDDVNRHDYIGRYVTAYYDNSDSQRKDILYMDYHEREKVLVITPETYAGYNANTFTYFAGNRTKTARINVGSAVYNGYYRTSWNKALFDGMTHGSITLVSMGSGMTYDTMIIKDYKSVYVNGIEGNKFYIYNKAYDGVGTTYDFEFMADDNGNSTAYVYIADAAGNKINFSDIKEGNVVSIAQASTVANVAEILVSTETVSDFAINEITTDENGNQIISDFDTQYKINKEYKNAFDGGDFEAGEVAILYLDVFGYVSWAEISDAKELYVGVLVKSGLTTDMDKQLKIAVYESDGEKQVFTTARKVRFIDNKGRESVETPVSLADKIKNKNEYITYTLNDDDLITSLEFALDATSSKPTGAEKNYLTKVKDGSTPSFNYYSKSLGFELFFASSPRFIAVSEDNSSEMDAYSIVKSISSAYSHANLTSKFPTMKGYSINGNNVVDYVLFYGTVSKTIDVTDNEVVVTSVTSVYDEEAGGELVKVQGYNGTGVTLYALPGIAQSATSMVTRNDATPKKYTVQKGDIIKYKLDEITGWVEEFVIVFRSDGKYSTDNDGDDVADIAVQTDGWILDGVLKTPSSTVKNGNPIKINSSGTLTTVSLADDSSSSRNATNTRRIFYGWVYDKYDGIIEVTTQDLGTGATYFNLNGDYNYQNLHDDYVTQYYKISAYGTKVNVTYTNVGNEQVIEAAAGSASDIKSYKQVGRNCSRVILATSGNDDVWYMIILNNK